MTNQSTLSRRRLVYIEYLLLKAIKDDCVVSIENKTLTGLDGKPTANALKAISVLSSKGLIDSDGITTKGKAYLEEYPLPKVKHARLFNMTKEDDEYLKKLTDSELSWTSSRLIADKASMLFKIVRYGYAVGMRNRNTEKLNKNAIMPTPSLSIPETRDQYFFKITKKGKDYLESIK
jgi:hypothetical protein